MPSTLTAEESKARANNPLNRVTLADIEKQIDFEKYANVADQFPNLPKAAADSLGTITQCFLVLKNGFTVIGKSACADPNNYDFELGCKIAKADAINQIWPLLGYEMRTKLHNAAAQDLIEGHAV